MLAALVCVPGAAPSAAVDPEPVRILLIGDSVTQGSSGDWTWRYRLWKHLQATSSVPVDLVGPRSDVWDYLTDAPGSDDYVDPAFDRDHAARWGMTLSFADNPIDDLVETYQPDIVVEMLGTNDLIFLDQTPDQVEANLENFVTSARSADPDVDVVLCEVTQTWFEGAPELNALLAQAADDLDSVDSRVVVADTDAGYGLSDSFDDSHPNAQGEVKIAAAVADALAAQGVGTAPARPLPDVPLGPRLPSVLTGSVAGGDVSLTWTRSPGAATVQVQQRDDTVGTGWTVVSDSEPGTTFAPVAVPRDHRLQFRVLPRKGHQVAAADAASNVVSLTVPSPPGRPVPAVRVRGTRSAVVTWPAVDRAASYTVELRRKGRTWRVVAADRTRRRLVLRDLRVGATYDVRVTATNSTGTGPASRRARFTFGGR